MWPKFISDLWTNTLDPRLLSGLATWKTTKQLNQLEWPTSQHLVPSRRKRNLHWKPRHSPPTKLVSPPSCSGSSSPHGAAVMTGQVVVIVCCCYRCQTFTLDGHVAATLTSALVLSSKFLLEQEDKRRPDRRFVSLSKTKHVGNKKNKIK